VRGGGDEDEGVSGPWTFHLHVVAWVCLGAALVTYTVGARRLGGTRRQAARFGAGLVALGAATTWPLADLGRRYSFAIQLADHLLIALVAVPLMLLGLPVSIVARLTARRWSDTAVRWLGVPLVAGPLSTAVLVAVHLPVVVDAEVISSAVAAIVTLAVLVAGVVLWLPVIGLVPGVRRLGTAGRIGYLVAVSILPNVPGSFLTFARSPVYARLVPGARDLGIDPTLDCQLAGALAKLVAAGVLWAVATVIFFRALEVEHDGTGAPPLEWAEVERAFQRSDWQLTAEHRRAHRARRRERPRRGELRRSRGPSTGMGPDGP